MAGVATIVVLLVAGVLAIAVVVAARRWRAGTRVLRARLAAARLPIAPVRADLREALSLPEPVARCLRGVFADGQPMIASVRLRHAGTFNLGEAGDRWRPFTSDQLVVTRRPGFDWDGRIEMALGIAVRVHDAYVAGEGILRATVGGLWPLAAMRGGGDLAAGELMRFLAEAAWYPTALLPSQGVRWEAAGERQARATLRDGEVVVSLLFRFDDQYRIAGVVAEARGRAVGGRVIPTGWSGRFWDHQRRSGVVVPLAGEVAWELADGPRPYWRGELREISYEFAAPER